MAYRIEYDPEAVLDIRFHGREASWIILETEEALRHEPTREVRNRRPARPGAPAAWELRVIPFRVFYDVDEENNFVYVVAVYKKDREVWRRRGRREQLDGKED